MPDTLATDKSFDGVTVRGHVLVDPSAKIGAGSVLGPDVVIGADCVVGDGVRLSNCTLLNGVSVDGHARVSDSIVGWGSRIGAWAQLVNHCVLGKDVSVSAESRLDSVVVCPFKGVKGDQPAGKIVL